jgi:hypothetical protein
LIGVLAGAVVPLGDACGALAGGFEAEGIGALERTGAFTVSAPTLPLDRGAGD